MKFSFKSRLAVPTASHGIRKRHVNGPARFVCFSRGTQVLPPLPRLAGPLLPLPCVRARLILVRLTQRDLRTATLSPRALAPALASGVPWRAATAQRGPAPDVQGPGCWSAVDGEEVKGWTGAPCPTAA